MAANIQAAPKEVIRDACGQVVGVQTVMPEPDIVIEEEVIIVPDDEM